MGTTKRPRPNLSADAFRLGLRFCLALDAIQQPNGALLGYTGGPNASLCAGAIIGPFVLQATGTYTLIVDPTSSYTGQIAATVYEFQDITGPIPLTGDPLTAPLTTPGQRALWTFDGTENQRVTVVATASTVTQCGNYNSFGFLNPDNTPLQTQWNMCAGAMVGPVTLSAPGTYKVLVDPAGANTGQVTVKAYNVVDETGPVIVNGPAVTGELLVPGQRGLWTFNGTAGQKVRAVVNTSTVPWCSIYNSFGILKPDGTPLGTQWNMCATALTNQLTLPDDGIYYLVADPAGSNTGTVTARVIDPVVLVNDTAPPTGITVPPSTVVTVQVNGTPGNSGDRMRLSVVGSAKGAYISQQNLPASGGPLTFTMPATPGQYQFRLFANGSTWIATSTTVTVQ